MKLIHLAGDLGLAEDSSLQNVRRALLVYAGTFQSMDGEVEVTPDHLSLIANNHNEKLKRIESKKGALAMGDYPPVQLDHSSSAMHTVGRLVGPVEIGQHEGIPALFGSVQILGAENLEKVNDGRWSHLSIGADLTAGEIQELTITPFPAAKNASLLSRYRGQNMKFTDEEMKKYLMDNEGIAEDEAETKLQEMDDEEKESMMKAMDENTSTIDDEKKEKTSMSEDEDEEDESRKLASDEDEDEKTSLESEENEDKKDLGDSEITIKHDADGDGELSDGDKKNDDEDEKVEAKKRMSSVVESFRAKSKITRLALQKARIGNTIARLKREAKISPAEIRKMNLDELASQNEKTIKAVLSSYENRQPVIEAGQYGTLKAMKPSEIAHDVRLHNLELETLQNMKFTGKVHSTRLQEDEKKGKEAPTSKVDEAELACDDDGMFSEIAKAIREERDDDAKELYRRARKMALADTSVDEAEMSALMSSVCDLETEFNSLVRLSAVATGVRL